MGVKNSQMFIQTMTAPRLQIIARWEPLPISMVLRSEKSLKLKMLHLAWTSKYVNNIKCVEHKKVRGGQLGLKRLTKPDSYCSDKLIFMRSDRIVVSNKNIYAI